MRARVLIAAAAALMILMHGRVAAAGEGRRASTNPIFWTYMSLNVSGLVSAAALTGASALHRHRALDAEARLDEMENTDPDYKKVHDRYYDLMRRSDLEKEAYIVLWIVSGVLVSFTVASLFLPFEEKGVTESQAGLSPGILALDPVTGSIALGVHGRF